MKRNQWIAAAGIAAGLVCGGWSPAMGEAPLTGTGSIMPAGQSAATIGIIGGADSTTAMAVADAAGSSAAAGVVSSGAGFLTDRDLGGGVTYRTMPLPEEFETHGEHDAVKDVVMPVGQLQIRRHGICETAYVVNWSVPEGKDPTHMAEQLFRGEETAEGKFFLQLANQTLTNAQPLINEKLLDGIGHLRKATGEAIPYSILHVELRSLDPIHRMREDPVVYTAGMRVLLYADGWVFPGYVKAYVYREGGAYRFIGLWAGDSERADAVAAGDALVASLFQK